MAVLSSLCGGESPPNYDDGIYRSRSCNDGKDFGGIEKSRTSVTIPHLSTTEQTLPSFQRLGHGHHAYTVKDSGPCQAGYRLCREYQVSPQ